LRIHRQRPINATAKNLNIRGHGECRCKSRHTCCSGRIIAVRRIADNYGNLFQCVKYSRRFRMPPFRTHSCAINGAGDIAFCSKQRHENLAREHAAYSAWAHMYAKERTVRKYSWLREVLRALTEGKREREKERERYRSSSTRQSGPNQFHSEVSKQGFSSPPPSSSSSLLPNHHIVASLYIAGTRNHQPRANDQYPELLFVTVRARINAAVIETQVGYNYKSAQLTFRF